MQKAKEFYTSSLGFGGEQISIFMQHFLGTYQELESFPYIEKTSYFKLLLMRHFKLIHPIKEVFTESQNSLGGKGS